MIEGVSRETLTAETILNKISPFDIFMFYMPKRPWKLNQVTYSPFRQEHNPSFIIGTKYGNLSFIDFADTGKRGDCFEFVKLLFGITDFYEVLLKIDRDFGLGIASSENAGEYKRIISEYKQPADIAKKYCLIQVVTRKFTKEELQYWNQYQIDLQDLKDNHIYSIKTLYLNRSRFPLRDTELRFGYLYENQWWKIYRPKAKKKDKWMPNNVPVTIMDGKENIKDCDVAFISKSRKDYMVIKKVFPWHITITKVE